MKSCFTGDDACSLTADLSASAREVINAFRKADTVRCLSEVFTGGVESFRAGVNTNGVWAKRLTGQCVAWDSADAADTTCAVIAVALFEANDEPV